MKKTIFMSLVWCVLWATVLCAQTTYYVATNGGHVSPYASWGNAATNIHDAVALAGAGDTVWVTNGSYRLTNMIVLATNFTVRSVNGPDMTTLWRDTNAGIFGLFLVTNANALVAGLTLTNGSLTDHGGGMYISAGIVSNCVIAKCQSVGTAKSTVYVNGGLLTGCVASNNSGYYTVGVAGSGVVENCTIITNTFRAGLVLYSGGVARRCRIMWNRSTSAGYGPAGVYLIGGGRLENSLVYGNSAANYVAGVRMTGGAMVNCTIAGNVAPGNQAEVGVHNYSGGTLTNCIMYGNGIGAFNENYYGTNTAVWSSCAPELTAGVQGNVTGNPRFVDAAHDDYRLSLGSPCLDSGTNVTAIVDDFDRTPRPLLGYAGSTVRHDMGAYEKNGTNGPFDVAFSGSPVSGFDSVPCVFTARVAGTNTTIAWWGWDFNNDGTFETNGTGLLTVTNTYGPGRHSVSVRVTNSIGETAASTNLNCVLVVSSNIYVSPSGSHVLPYATWGNAATNLHDAVRVALAGCTVWVSNGSYRLTNQLEVYSGFTVRSVNGPPVTTVWRDAAFGDFRLFDIRAPGALVTGLTLTNGYLNGIHGTALKLLDGTVTNCVIAKSVSAGTAISVAYVGGGFFRNCVVSNNSGYNMLGMAGGGVAEDCTIVTNAGRAGLAFISGGVVRRCRIMGNRSTTSGYGPAGVNFYSGGRLENSLVYGNTAANYNGAAVLLSDGCMINCTIAGNYATGSSGYGGVREAGGVITNCILYGNTGFLPLNNYSGAVGSVWYSCAPELTAGVQGNITSDPRFVNAVGADYHLGGGSPCMNKGVTLSGMASDVDLDKVPRVKSGQVDMGAYEVTFQSTVLMVR